LPEGISDEVMLVYRLYVQKHVHTAHAMMAYYMLWQIITKQQQQRLKQYPLVISQFAIENCPFIDCLPISHGHVQ
jgi:hypothetical protein